jgi:hypothetical protein
VSDEREIVYAAGLSWKGAQIEVGSAYVVKRTEKTVTIDSRSWTFGYKTRLMPYEVHSTAETAVEAERARLRAEVDTMRKRISRLEAAIAADYVLVKP